MSNRLIYLMGFMASGKTSVGQKLAKQLGVDFIDLDQQIEQEEQQSITEIFKEKGETYFRVKEAEVLRAISFERRCLIALGGGTVSHSSNMSYINKNGLSIYLKRSNERLLGRLRQKKIKRPLIAHLSDLELKHFIDKTIEERTPFYEQANLVVDADSFQSKQDLIQFLEKEIN